MADYPKHRGQRTSKRFTSVDERQQMFDSYVRGESTHQIAIIGSDDICNGIRSIIEKETGVHVSVCRLQGNGISRIAVSGGKQAHRVLSWLYRGATIKLERKYEKYKQLRW